MARFLGLPNVLHGMRAGDGTVTCALGRIVRPGASGPVAVVVRVNAVRVNAVRLEPHSTGAAARVSSVQHRVAGTLVHVDVGGEQVIGVPAPGLDMAAGDIVELSVDLNAIHVLDPSHGSGDV